MDEKYKELKIKELKRDIQIMKDIVDGKIENYTKHSIVSFKENILKYSEQLRNILKK